MTNKAYCSVITAIYCIILFWQRYHGCSCKIIWPFFLLIHILTNITEFLCCLLSYIGFLTFLTVFRPLLQPSLPSFLILPIIFHSSILLVLLHLHQPPLSLFDL